MVSLLLFCFGIMMLSFGVYHFTGSISVWYLAHSNRIYGTFPSGISMILLAFAISHFVPNNGKMTVIILAIISLPIGSFFAERILKPVWLQRLEQEHSAILPMLRIEIQEMGAAKWNRQINTQEELEKWIDDVKLQHKLKTVGAAAWEHPITTREEWDEWINNKEQTNENS